LRHRRRSNFLAKAITAVVVLAIVRACSNDRDRERDDPSEIAAKIDLSIAPPPDATSTPREGIAAVVLMDVSGSMNDDVRGGDEQKIAIARRAAFDLLTQFDTYARAHPDEPVQVGLFEFSSRSAREVLPLSAPDLTAAKSALANMRADGGTPIGDALIAGKRALDRAALSRRHLLVVTDGDNTEGYDPDEVMAALNRRPEAERPSVYFVAFDISASRFDAVRNAGGLVLEAADAKGLNETLDFLLTGKILVEGQ